MSLDSHTYVVLQNNYTVTKDGEVKQIGGDWYNIFTSKGEIRIPGDVIKKLVRRGCTPQAIEVEGKKYNDTFKLSGGLILERGTPFGDTTVYIEDIGDGREFDTEDETLVEEFNDLTKSFEEQLSNINDTQEKLRSVSKKILSKKRTKK